MSLKNRLARLRRSIGRRSPDIILIDEDGMVSMGGKMVPYEEARKMLNRPDVVFVQIVREDWDDSQTRQD